MSKQKDTKEIVDQIAENYKELEKKIASELSLKFNEHHLTTGHNREEIWMSLFRQIIPMKFAIRQGVFLIDSHGKVSKEVDLAVFDEQYTPYIFNYGKIHFIPIEAVAMVVQCKSKTLKNKKLEKWLWSIGELSTEEGGIARIATCFTSLPPKTQKKTRPLQVLCHLSEEAHKSEHFDLCISSSSNGLKIKWKEGFSSIEEISKTLNGIGEVKIVNESLENLEVPGNTILTLILQLNQVLMLINNPMLFPHYAYARLFRDMKD